MTVQIALGHRLPSLSIFPVAGLLDQMVLCLLFVFLVLDKVTLWSHDCISISHVIRAGLALNFLLLLFSSAGVMGVTAGLYAE